MDNLDEYYRAYAKINLDCIYTNMFNLKSNVKEDTNMVAVVKADGYGHGAVPVAKTIDNLVKAYAVATIDEAIILRKHNITKPIYLLGFIPDLKIDVAILNNVRFAVFEKSNAITISQRAIELGENAIVHIKIDTGMGRIGFPVNEKTVEEILEISKLPGIEVEGIFTHFAKADECNKEMTKMQLSKYRDIIAKLHDKGLEIKIKHCSNSAGIIDIPEANMNEVRAGISLYGMYPSDEVNKKTVKLLPALELKSHVIFIKEVEKDIGIGYGSAFITKRKTKVATIPVGYGDGYPRNLSNKGDVLIRGQRAPIIGRVCMDQFMIDVTDIKDVSSGDEVTLVGNDGYENITVEELSKLAGTFNYEFVCNLGKRIPRVFYRNNKIVCTKDYFEDKYNLDI